MNKRLKQYSILGIIFCAFASCSAQQNSVVQQVDALGRSETIEDSVIRRLRDNNDLVIAYAVENFAWVRSANYLIIAKNSNEWTGYHYYVSLMHNPGQPAAPGNINPAEVNKLSCDSLLEYISKTKAWTIKGDSGENFCPNSNQSCNINDASGARLWIITKQGSVNPSYYAPEFFEECCPGNKDRALFLSIAKKIEQIVSVDAISK
ncbi:MAG TPA: hypothetical protein VEV83_07960 [Parafilimonas sp.]|nr:hypothetical protein [Parafilimonas sp.]